MKRGRGRGGSRRSKLREGTISGRFRDQWGIDFSIQQFRNEGSFRRSNFSFSYTIYELWIRSFGWRRGVNKVGRIVRVASKSFFRNPEIKMDDFSSLLPATKFEQRGSTPISPRKSYRIVSPSRRLRDTYAVTYRPRFRIQFVVDVSTVAAPPMRLHTGRTR